MTHLRPVKKPANVILAYPLRARMAFGVILLLIIGISLIFYSIQLIAILGTIVCVVGMIYREEWTLSKNKLCLQTGIGIIFRWHDIDLEQIQKIYLDQEEKIILLKIKLSSGDEEIIDRYFKKQEKMAILAADLFRSKIALHKETTTY